MGHIDFIQKLDLAASGSVGAQQAAHAGNDRALAGRRLMIDGHNLGLEKGTGVATYARNLSYCLRDLGCEVDVLYGTKVAPGSSALMKEIGFFDGNVRAVPPWMRAIRATTETLRAPLGYRAAEVPMTGTVIRDEFRSRLPYFDRIYNAKEVFRRAHNAFGVYKRLQRVHGPTPDLMHWTFPLPLLIGRVPNIYTLHDLVPLRLPFTTLDNKRRYLKLVQQIASKADHVVTVSETSRSDIIKILGIEESRITNTYQAVSIPAKYAEKPLDVVEREVEGTFGLPFKNYFLFFGSIEPKKNIGRLIEGYLSANLETPLVIVGAQAWKSEQELRLLYEDHVRSLVTVGAETRVKRKVVQLAYAPFPLLVSLIRGAKATVFPSLYEGFGLPVLESMTLGTPVLSSTASSIPEVAKDAAMLVDPYDTRAISATLATLDSDEGLRDELAAKGRERARVFSEAAYKERLLRLYSKLL
jgi:glycosyltransferase involved in cell wall biosynthesis